MNGAKYKWYLLGLLMLIQSFSPVDRLALGLLTQDIKLDLKLTDTQLGALDGMAFALFYATMGIPIARWADRGHRGRIMAATTTVWAIAVPLCGLARNFVQLAFARLVAGVGEAGCDPAANSLISEYFGRDERVRAMTISALSSPMGSAIGYGMAGWIGQHYGWRVTFAALGVPGLVLALLAALTLREPRMSLAQPAGSRPGAQLLLPVGVWQTCLTLWKSITFRHLTVMYVVSLFFNYGIYTWLPTYFVRSYGMKDDELGVWFAVTNGVAGFVGTYLGGELAYRFARHNEPLQLKWMAAVSVVSTLMQGAVFLTHNRYLALGFMAASIVLGLTTSGPVWAILMTIVPQRMRATSTAILYLLGNLIGMGIGPMAAGALSDFFRPLFGEESLRYVLLVLTPGYLWAAWHTWAPHKTVLYDARMAEIELQGAREEEAAATQTRGSAS